MAKTMIKNEHDVLEQQKQAVEDIISVRLITTENSVFSRTVGGFVSLTFTGEDGKVTEYNRVAVHRCFPHSDPDHYISIREPEGDGREIGLIEDISLLPDETVNMLEEQLSLRYFAPKVLKVNHIREEYGYSYWDVLTDKGACRFTVRMGSGNVYSIGKDRYLINDLDGNRFEIPNLYELTPREIKQLDLFI
ncbi:MAG: DUF1854 domain-containing protein [Oscillospiraceae bacterium]|nr:DUF1854 domain-containing protein [Oscillospiraceae bacterium]MDD4546909.1 DUF1854 domain-containing protein [Oscillospiraceae bacterium]